MFSKDSLTPLPSCSSYHDGLLLFSLEQRDVWPQSGAEFKEKTFSGKSQAETRQHVGCGRRHSTMVCLDILNQILDMQNYETGRLP